MALTPVNLGTTPNDGTGDDPRTGMAKVNANFADPTNMAAKLAQTSPTDVTPDRGLLTTALDADGNVWGASNITTGTTPNGTFWRYPDGKMVCTGSISLSVTLGAITDGTNFSDQLTMTFPSPFISPPEVASRGGVAGRVAWSGADAITATTCIIRMFANATVSGTAAAGYVAVGKWK